MRYSVVYLSANNDYGTQLFVFLFPEKGGLRTGDDYLASDTCLVHSQLQVRGGVSPGQYHSTVVARYSPVSYLRNIVSSGCRPAEGPYRPSDLAQTHSGLTGYGPRSATSSQRIRIANDRSVFFLVAPANGDDARSRWVDRDAVLHDQAAPTTAL